MFAPGVASGRFDEPGVKRSSLRPAKTVPGLSPVVLRKGSGSEHLLPFTPGSRNVSSHMMSVWNSLQRSHSAVDVPDDLREHGGDASKQHNAQDGIRVASRARPIRDSE